jgi:hypothetical protein
VRCFEGLQALSDASITVLATLAKGKRGWCEHAMGLIIRHRAAVGLALARQQMARLTEFGYDPVVTAITSIRDLEATDILADAVRKISSRKHPLRQSGRNFALAVGRLWASARDGDLQAQEALRMVGRRWKRIPPETLALLREHVPRLTRSIATAGGSGKGRRKSP